MGWSKGAGANGEGEIHALKREVQRAVGREIPEAFPITMLKKKKGKRKTFRGGRGSFRSEQEPMGKVRPMPLKNEQRDGRREALTRCEDQANAILSSRPKREERRAHAHKHTGDQQFARERLLILENIRLGTGSMCWTRKRKKANP